MSVRVAAIQMVSKPAVEDNLRDARALIAAAAAQGAELVALPDYICLMGQQETEKMAVRDNDCDVPVQQFLAAQARTHGIWLVGGTAPLADPAGERVRNSVLV
ncbi:MAG: nitrilase-related carbon-nitrogen hydrolase, partial [Betaproteobacteria bacterium]